MQIATSPTNLELADAMATDTPRILSTHTIGEWLPLEIRDDPKAKVIYVARNPKDVAVSYYYFCNCTVHLPSYDSWDVFFEEFIRDRGVCTVSTMRVSFSLFV